MDYRLLYTEKALNDLAEIIGYISEDDPDAASQFGNALLDHIGLLARFPRMGQLVRERSKLRKLLHSPVAVYYRVHQDRRLVEVVHFRHSARREPGK